MIRLNQFQHCICQRMGCNPALCDGQFGFEEKGKRVCCKPKNGERVAAILTTRLGFCGRFAVARGSVLFEWAGTSLLNPRLKFVFD